MIIKRNYGVELGALLNKLITYMKKETEKE